MFPTGVGMYGIFMRTLPPEYGYAPTITRDHKEYGDALIAAYNRWGMSIPATTDRVRPVLPVIANSVPELLRTTREMIDAGIRAIWLPSSVPPGGVSPAAEELKPFWSLLEDNDVAACLHLGIEPQIYASGVWNDAPAFEGFKILEELKLDPWSLSSAHIPAQNFVTTMVQGWVFEEHPRLRFGVLETGAYWIGPLCQLMDLWYEQSRNFALPLNPRARLPHPPSYYVKRNVRVSGFDFEPIDEYIVRYDLEDVLCFASDYPHLEGGTNPMGEWLDKLRPLGPAVIDKFFSTNGRWILPE